MQWNPPPPPQPLQKLLRHFQTTKEADFDPTRWNMEDDLNIFE
jgi:hypothetical protein